MGPNERPKPVPASAAGTRRQQLLAVLARADRPLDASEAGRAIGLHRNSVRAHLEALASAGLVRKHVEPRATRGRPRVLYETTAPEAIAPTTKPHVGYEALAGALAGQMTEMEDVAAESIRAGRRWAAALDSSPISSVGLSPQQALSDVKSLLAKLGFDPELDARRKRILLHECPFAKVARQAVPVICGMHLGMLKATLERTGAPLDVAEFRPLLRDDPVLCLVSFRTKQDGFEDDPEPALPTQKESDD